MNKLELLIALAQKTSKSELVKMTEKGKATIDKLIQKVDKNSALLADFANDFFNQYKIHLKEEDYDVLFLTTYGLEWYRPETFSKEGYLEGGFSFNGLEDLYSNNPHFWKDAVNDFIKFQPKKKVDYSFLECLRWLESTHHYSNPNSGNLPYTACVTLDEDRLPSKFYFFDGGLVFELTIDSYDDYVKALTDSSGVTCWQYFYINPDEIIDKNIEVNYMTWVLKTSDLADGINDLAYDENITYDRLDLVAEYLERCIRLLPSTFPFLDFSYHKEHYRKFKVLYDQVRQK